MPIRQHFRRGREITCSYLINLRVELVAPAEPATLSAAAWDARGDAGPVVGAKALHGLGEELILIQLPRPGPTLRAVRSRLARGNGLGDFSRASSFLSLLNRLAGRWRRVPFHFL